MKNKNAKTKTRNIKIFLIIVGLAIVYTGVSAGMNSFYQDSVLGKAAPAPVQKAMQKSPQPAPQPPPIAQAPRQIGRAHV